MHTNKKYRSVTALPLTFKIKVSQHKFQFHLCCIQYFMQCKNICKVNKNIIEGRLLQFDYQLKVNGFVKYDIKDLRLCIFVLNNMKLYIFYYPKLKYNIKIFTFNHRYNTIVQKYKVNFTFNELQSN